MIHCATHRHSGVFRVGTRGIDQHTNAIFIIDEIGPIVIDQGNTPARVRGVDLRGVAVTRRALTSGDAADLLKVGVLTNDRFNGNGFAKAGTLLLNKVFDIAFILLNKRGGNLNRHSVLLLRWLKF